MGRRLESIDPFLMEYIVCKLNLPDDSHDDLTIDRPRLPMDVLVSNGLNWVMKITPTGIVFNREGHPDWEIDDFAIGVLEIIEKCYINDMAKYSKDGYYDYEVSPGDL